jgi:hypothetical protein
LLGSATRGCLRPGWIAIWLLIGFFVIAAIVSVDVAVGGDGHPLFALPLGVTAFGGGIAAVIAVVRHRDRGFLIFLPALVALLALAFGLADLLVPQ